MKVPRWIWPVAQVAAGIGIACGGAATNGPVWLGAIAGVLLGSFWIPVAFLYLR